MHKNKAATPTHLFYRIYVTYFQAPQIILKTINKHAFYRLSIFNGKQEIADMPEGVNPVILADKIFLSNALLNFTHAVNSPRLMVKLTSHFRKDDYLMGESILNLQKINDNYFQFTQRFNSLQSISFQTDKGPIKLIFNIFVESNKVDLDIYIKKFKQNERQIMRIKIQQRSKRKYNQENQKIQKQSESQRNEEISDYSSNIAPKLSILPTSGQKNPNQPDNIHNKEDRNGDLASVSNKNYLEINSAAKFHSKRIDNNIHKIKNVLNDIEQKQFQTYSSQMESFRNSRLLSYEMGTTSIISDGSQQSQMIANNLTETYSERAVAKFKQNTFKLMNIFLIIVALILMYYLLAPSARFAKQMKKKSTIQKFAEDLIEIQI